MSGLKWKTNKWEPLIIAGNCRFWGYFNEKNTYCKEGIYIAKYYPISSKR